MQNSYDITNINTIKLVHHNTGRPKRNKIVRRCNVCNSEYTAHRITSMYCSNKCAQIACRDKAVNCESCGKGFRPAKYSRRNGRGKYCSSQCWADCCSKSKLHNRKWLRKNHLKDKCDRCGFIAEDKCQLDLDHVDGDSTNHSDNNLQTLCANCHRLKTQLCGDGKWKK
jgi:HNH endonuclease